MISNYSKIVKIIESGHLAVMEFKDDESFVIFSSKCDDGDIRYSMCLSTIEGCKESLGLYHQSKSEINNCKNIKIYPLIEIPKMMQPGELVDISEEVKKVDGYDDWGDEAQDMVGQKGLEIKETADYLDGYWIYTKDKSDWWTFPSWTVSCHLGDEEDTKKQKLLTKAQELIDKAQELKEEAERL